MSKRDISQVSQSTGESSTRRRTSSLPFNAVSLDESRIRSLSNASTTSVLPSGKCVIYWMSRDQRAEDNYALLCARDIAREKNVPVRVVFNLVPKFLEATLRQYSFMIDGLREVEQHLRNKNIPFHLLLGDPTKTVPEFCKTMESIALVTDFSPLRVSRSWTQSVAAKLEIPMFQVDAHNIVPCWVASDKLEYAARTIRPKITSKIPQYLVPIPELEANAESSVTSSDFQTIDWSQALDSLQIDRSITPVSWLAPGPAAAMENLRHFASVVLRNYGEKRNDPNENALSNMSPYFHFGQLSAQRAVLYLKSQKAHGSSCDTFIEEAVVRRELADNFCFYNPRYDSLEGCYDWAKDTLRTHESDPREVLYTLEEFETAMTHDDLWNAAQLQMVREGKMHGFLRMYWAKKILEWTPTPSEALRIAIYLNDKYELDGRDPNGYVGCMWSIGGIHDQGWNERAVFGKIRYMNYQGCKRKFDVPRFVSKYPPSAENAARVSKAKKISIDNKKKK